MISTVKFSEGETYSLCKHPVPPFKGGMIGYAKA